MDRRSYFALLLSLVVAAVLLWSALLFSVLGFDELFSLFELPSSVALEAFSNFGSSFGILAALFSGLAVVLLWQSIKVQQTELHELRDQMLHDRRITEFTWLLTAFESSREKASITHMDPFDALSQLRGNPPLKEITQGHRLVYKEATKFIEKRKSGDLFPIEDVNAFRCQHSESGAGQEVNKWDPLMPFYVSARQIARYLSQVEREMQRQLYPMFASVATLFDMVVLHDKMLILDDQEFIYLAEDVGMFSEYGSALKEKLKGGPIIRDSAFLSPDY